MTSAAADPAPLPARRPQFVPPAGACDCHFHLFGPHNRFPLPPGRARQVGDRTLDDFLRLQAMTGFSRGLLVQSFQHGHTYEYMLHALARAPDRLRAVAMPASDITDAELDILTRAGVVGIRFAPRATPAIDSTMMARVHEHGWAAHLLLHGQAEVEAWGAAILALPGRFVLEHTGYPDPAAGLSGREFRFVLACLETGRCWVKLSTRFSHEPGPPFADALPFIHALVERAPDRLLWGSGWPHQSHPEPKPDDADLVDLLPLWIPDADLRQRILVDNPARLFGFPALAG